MLPASYSGSHLVPCVFHPSRMGVIHAHEASTASRRMKRDASPAMTSSSKRSYASGDGAPNASPWRKCIPTGCVLAFAPGTFEMIRRAKPALRAHGVLLYFVPGDRTQAAEHVYPGVADELGIERVGGVHRDEAEQLQDVVLDHIPERACLFIICGPASDAFRFAHRDLDMIDILMVPNRIENAVGEP